jgi:hypothetical protein
MRPILRIAALGVAAAFLVLTWRQRTENTPPPPVPRPSEARASHGSQREALFSASTEAATIADLARSLNAANASAILAQMSATLSNMSRLDTAAAIVALLDSGLDAATGQHFNVGSGGKLSSSPTLRVWLLDQLGAVDPNAAASYAAKIYSGSNSADEWAVALRNDWRIAASAGRIDNVRARVLQLSARATWADNPSIGFLEALDLHVATLAWEAVPQFELWLQPSRPLSLRSAAWIALDRMAMEGPSDFLPALAQHRNWLESQPLLRAGLLARAHLGVTRERMAVEHYLQRDDISDFEGRRFLELLPNISGTVSHGLVTTPRLPNLLLAAQLDRAALSVVREWQATNALPRWKHILVTTEARLTQTVASAARGGF